MENIGAYLESLAATLSATPHAALQSIEQSLWATYQRDGTIIICGNGGSAATASHFACDLAKWTICKGQPRVRSTALTDNVPVMLAWSNDTHYERVFVEQLMNLYRPGDTLVAISGSGNSPSVLRAVEWANEQGVDTISMTGFGGGQLDKIAQVGVIAPSHFMPEVEDVHMAICHALAVSIGKRIKQLLPA
ncbi:MAG: SIS domain-containing protein [Chloroflexi bacterium AL-W]|nr:SIS domain-containing protein [Chloroflexi bacterium AL-N1]NOK66150.1 SIS domain-containing protein [Chloroflexi bacterium AL-N10]NOK73031.1 SIS domain-containing protein [Chloroflexi bacterium AL-N5]NOK79928.1 SIS domain-containing protein [Chloroflexi bacterium AL-W]NOK88216.1 SIS domain-containing protein [Chloroflexi bacterium AL-N15]